VKPSEPEELTLIKKHLQFLPHVGEFNIYKQLIRIRGLWPLIISEIQKAGNLHYTESEHFSEDIKRMGRARRELKKEYFRQHQQCCADNYSCKKLKPLRKQRIVDDRDGNPYKKGIELVRQQRLVLGVHPDWEKTRRNQFEISAVSLATFLTFLGK